MNAADRQVIARLADVAARFIQVPRPHIDEALPSAEYSAAYDKARKQFFELQREQAIRLGGHLEWLAREDDTLPLQQRIGIITKIMAEDLAGPLPYPVKPEPGQDELDALETTLGPEIHSDPGGSR